MKSKDITTARLDSQGKDFISGGRIFFLQFYLVAVTVFFIEMTMFSLLFADMVNLRWVLLTHLGVMSLLFLWTELLRRRKKSISLALLFASVVLVLGPLGVVGTLLSIGFHKFLSGGRVESVALYEQLFNVPDERLSYEYLNNADTDILPFVDIFSFGSVTEKRTVIMLISRYFRPAFTRVLFLALKDNNPSVRVLAATAISKIEKSFMDKTMSLENKLCGNPCEPELLLGLATHYDDYAYTGLLRQEEEQGVKQKALNFYKAYLEQSPEDITARVALSRLLLRENRLDEASVHLEAILEGESDSLHVVFWYIECLYRLKRYEELRRFATKHMEKVSGSTWPDNIIDAVSLWGGSERPEHAGSI